MFFCVHLFKTIFMKTKLLLVFLSIAGVFSAQNLSLTQSAFEPIVGDTNQTYIMDTSWYATGTPNNLSGPNVIWDFSFLVPTPSLSTSAYLSSSQVTVTSPVGTSFVQQQGPSYNFFKSTTTPTTQTELMAVNLGSISLTFTNTGIIAKYPIDYGYSLTDGIGGSVTFSIPASFNGNVVTEADGKGTLFMPQNKSYTNVLRVKSTQLIAINVVFLGNIANLNQTVYSYYHASSKFPILTVNHSITTFSTQTTDVTTFTGNSDFLTIGLNEQTKNDFNFATFPNPANEQLTIQLKNNQIAESVTLINNLGQIVAKNTKSNTLNVSQIPAGYYYIEVSSEGYLGRKPVLITK